MTPTVLLLALVLALLAGDAAVVLLAVGLALGFGLAGGLAVGAAHPIAVEDAARWARRQADTYGAKAQAKRDHARRAAALRAARTVKVARTAVAMVLLASNGLRPTRSLAQRIAGPAPWPGHQPPEPIGSPVFHGDLDGLTKEER